MSLTKMWVSTYLALQTTFFLRRKHFPYCYFCLIIRSCMHRNWTYLNDYKLSISETRVLLNIILLYVEFWGIFKWLYNLPFRKTSWPYDIVYRTRTCQYAVNEWHIHGDVTKPCRVLKSTLVCPCVTPSGNLVQGGPMTRTIRPNYLNKDMVVQRKILWIKQEIII